MGNFKISFVLSVCVYLTNLEDIHWMPSWSLVQIFKYHFACLHFARKVGAKKYWFSQIQRLSPSNFKQTGVKRVSLDFFFFWKYWFLLLTALHQVAEIYNSNGNLFRHSLWLRMIQVQTGMDRINQLTTIFTTKSITRTCDLCQSFGPSRLKATVGGLC